ncbi:ACSL4 [Cordylochernes scorpioides]|uniref:ACSL4 n=1 Tax=Cordylochernes scorpioides TaxID=51811 RepID=A0ABY6L0B4_9ARAC|nr:ACSL4 [Cordylochernes scorpioides]
MLAGGYEVTDRPRPRGEVLIGGDSVARGYFKQDQLTAETFVTLEGVRYCRSGDIGELTPHGTLIIIGEYLLQNDIMHTIFCCFCLKKQIGPHEGPGEAEHGEYVSLGRVEAELKTSPLVDNLCVLGSGCCPFLAAVVCPNVFQLSLLARQASPSSHTCAQIEHKEITRSII